MLKKISFARALRVSFSALLLCLAPLFGLAPSVFAEGTGGGVYISEIMYDSEGADIDWLEVSNGGSSDADIASLKLLVSNSVSNHAIKPYSGSSVISAGEYAVIVANSQVSAYLDKYGNSGNIFTASFSLPNVAEDQTATVELNAGDKNAPVNSVSYEAILGAGGDGNSLQLIEGAWKSSAPTPGRENVFTENGSGEGADSEYSDASGGVAAKEPPVRAKIFSSLYAFAGEPAEFRGAILERGKEVVHYGKFYWNFGDGSSSTEGGPPEKFSHVYAFPGDYAVFLEYYPSSVSGEPEFSQRMALKAVPIELSVKGAGNGKNFGAVLLNSSAYEINISGWKLSAGEKTFVFPRNSVILPKKSVVISGQATGFLPEDEKSLKLISGLGETVSSFQSYDY